MCEFFYSLYFDFKPVIRDTKALIRRCGEHIVVRRTAVVGKVVKIETVSYTHLDVYKRQVVGGVNVTNHSVLHNCNK